MNLHCWLTSKQTKSLWIHKKIFFILFIGDQQDTFFTQAKKIKGH